MSTHVRSNWKTVIVNINVSSLVLSFSYNFLLIENTYNYTLGSIFSCHYYTLDRERYCFFFFDKIFQSKTCCLVHSVAGDSLYYT